MEKGKHLPLPHSIRIYIYLYLVLFSSSIPFHSCSDSSTLSIVTEADFDLEKIIKDGHKYRDVKNEEMSEKEAEQEQVVSFTNIHDDGFWRTYGM